MSENVLKIEALSHSYSNKNTLNELTFDVPKGEFFIIAGPNGSGKTTLLKLLAGIEKIQNGDVNIFEKGLTISHEFYSV